MQVSGRRIGSRLERPLGTLGYFWIVPTAAGRPTRDPVAGIGVKPLPGSATQGRQVGLVRR
jgi:hypothetical protein